MDKLQALRTKIAHWFEQTSVTNDKELLRFMPARFEALDFSSQQQAAACQVEGYHDLGNGAWSASFDDMPFIPLQLESLIDDLCAQPAPMSLMRAAVPQIRVLYIPRSLLGELNPHSSAKHISPWEFPKELLSRDDDRGISIHSSSHKARRTLDVSGSGEVRSWLLLIVIIEPGALVKLSDVMHITGGLSSRILIGSLGAGAQLELISDQQFGGEATNFQYERWHIGKSAKLTSLVGLTGGAQTYGVKEFYLQENASISHLSLMALKDSEQAALTTKQIHLGAKSTSSVLVKSVLLGESRSFYRGTIGIKEQAKQSQADQQQRSLILSPSARTCAIPSLEVATHDVKCAHGSAAGRFNKEELWFLLSRGLNADQAYDLLIQGFYNESLFDDRSELAEIVRERLIERCRS